VITVDGSSLLVLLMIVARVSAFIAVAPPLNSRSVPPTVKAGLAAALGLLMLKAQTPYAPEISFGSIVGALAINIFIGLAMGFVVYVLFAAVQSAGHFVDVFGGYAMTASYDPMSANPNSVFGRFYNVTAIALFMVTPAHAITLAGLSRSFEVVPLNGSINPEAVSATMTDALIQMFLAALQFAGPLIAILVIADVALGLLTRVAPTLNAFSLGFPLKMMVVLVLVGTTFVLFPQTVNSLGDKGTTMFLEMLGAGS
jgi:flagellar biosynthetic protein FliR